MREVIAAFNDVIHAQELGAIRGVCVVNTVSLDLTVTFGRKASAIFEMSHAYPKIVALLIQQS